MKKLFIVFALTSVLFSYGNKIFAQNIGKPGPNITDIEGNLYKTVYIGTQQWMAENLKVSKYNDSTKVPNITDNTQWSNLTTGAWAYYNNDTTNNAKHGKLYNWYVVSLTTNGNKNVCPTGWHVPTNVDWAILVDYLGGDSIAGGKMKEVGTTSWDDLNTGVTNSSLFTGLPSGFRGYYGGDGKDIGNFVAWWSSTENLTSNACYRYLTRNRNNLYSFCDYSLKGLGFSIRCLKD